MTIQRLRREFPIVDEQGKPTEYFLRFLRDNNVFAEDTEEEVGDALSTAQAAAATATAAQGTATTAQTEVDALEGVVAALDLNALTDVDTVTTPPTDQQALVFDNVSGLWLPGDVAAGGGGGGGGAIEFIGEVVAVGGETSLSIDSISQDYTDLIVAGSFNATGSVELHLRFNDDATAIYDAYRQYGGRTTGGDQVISQTEFHNLAWTSALANHFISVEAMIRLYSESDRWKVIHSRASQPTAADNASEGHNIDIAGKWRSTSPITKITYFPAAGSFNAGSKIQLYGRKAIASGGGGGAEWQEFTVAAPGDGFINVPLDADGGTSYEVSVSGLLGASNTGIPFRLSSDDGATFFSGAADYKYNNSSSSNQISLNNGNTSGAGRKFDCSFIITELNTPAGRPGLSGSFFTASSTGSVQAGVVGGHTNGLGAGDFNAFQISLGAGAMDNMRVRIRKIV